jgi:hypothetical protein
VIIFVSGLAVGVLTAAVYVVLAVRAFLRVRGQVLAGDERVEAEPSTAYDGRSRYFAWKAVGGMVASTLLPVLVSMSGLSWYLLPFLAIGTSIAVILAFLLDRRA